MEVFIMPRRDGTGPNGSGGCGGINQQTGNGAGKNSGGGRGIGRQCGNGTGRGQGYKSRNGAGKNGSST